MDLTVDIFRSGQHRTYYTNSPPTVWNENQLPDSVLYADRVEVIYKVALYLFGKALPRIKEQSDIKIKSPKSSKSSKLNYDLYLAWYNELFDSFGYYVICKYNSLYTITAYTENNKARVSEYLNSLQRFRSTLMSSSNIPKFYMTM